MKNIDIKNRIAKLREEISRLAFLYHTLDKPEVSDSVYDSLNNELKLLLQKHPEFIDLNAPENRVGGKPLEKFEKVKHDIRLLSLNDAFSKEEVIDWENRINKIIETKKSFDYFCEIKLDGLSSSLLYRDGVFVRGATRGDGWIGEDVTENLKMINTVPLKLKTNIKGLIEVRGEVVMTKKAWQDLNKKQEQLGKPLFANTRNAAAGSLRQLDPKIVKDRKLDFFAWDIAQYPENILNHSDKHKILKELGFQIAPYDKKVKNLDEVFFFIEEIGNKREKMPYGTDGMVVSVDSLELQENMGHVGKAPRYMIAYKYPAEKAATVVTNITVNVGRTGAITPLAHFTPTFVAGSKISKATLHNMDQIERLDIRVGDTVVIQKAGDVIPEVVEVLINMRTGKEKKFKIPDNCPVCNSKIERKQSVVPLAGKALSRKVLGRGGTRGQTIALETLSSTTSVAYYCINKNCPARSRRGLQHFVNVFEIYEIGPKILDRLQDEGLITDAADLFTLETSDLSGLERFGLKSAENIINSIESHKKVLLWRFLYALGIIHVGEQTAQDIANHFGGLDKIMKASKEEINSIENIGPIVTDSIFEFFRQKENVIFIEKLFENGVSVDISSVKRGMKLKDKIFVLTGTLQSLSRDDAKKKIIIEGGRVSSSVSTKTNYVVVGAEAGSKLKEAQKNGVKTLSEEEFLKMF